MLLLSGLVQHGSHVGRSAYGTKTVVRSYSEYGVAIDRDSPDLATVEKGDPGAVTVYSFTFPCDVVRARAIKPFLRALVVGKLAGTPCTEVVNYPPVMNTTLASFMFHFLFRKLVLLCY